LPNAPLDFLRRRILLIKPGKVKVHQAILAHYLRPRARVFWGEIPIRNAGHSREKLALSLPKGGNLLRKPSEVGCQRTGFPLWQE
jgi:hypothetical protein